MTTNPAVTADRTALREAAERARDLIANYLWNEDDSGDEANLEDAHDALVAVLGPGSEESVAAALEAATPAPQPDREALAVILGALDGMAVSPTQRPAGDWISLSVAKAIVTGRHPLASGILATPAPALPAGSLKATRLPGESPCSFTAGADGWSSCDVHGWSGPASQRSRVLVCPSAALAASQPAPDARRLRDAIKGLRPHELSAENYAGQLRAWKRAVADVLREIDRWEARP